MFISHRSTTILTLLLIIITGNLVSAAGVRHDNIGAVELYNLAVDEATAGNYSQAENLTAQALSIQPNFTLALVTRTSVLISLGRINEAKESLDKALVLDPENPVVLTTAASYHLQTNENREAVQYAAKALAADPTMVEAWIIKGTAYGSLGEYEKELNASEQALNISPGNKLALTNQNYAAGMLKQGKKTPMSIPVLLFAILTGAVLVVMRKQ